MKLILFDCDGTLVDSVARIHQCMARTFDAACLPIPDLIATKEIIGLSLNLAIAQLADLPMSDQVEQLTTAYKTHFVSMRQEPDFDEPLFDGIASLIADLSSHDDVLLGMVTGKSRRGVEAVIERHGFEKAFQIWRTADDCPSKPHPAMVQECCDAMGCTADQTYVIGDTTYDIQMARNAGATAIGVTWGYHQPQRLLDAGAHFMLEQPQQLKALLKI